MTLVFDWNPTDEPAEVVDVAPSGAWDALIARYTGGRKSAQLERVVEIAKDHGIQSLIIETRYVDFDWRSEHAHFYATTFARYPSVCHRVHFFAAPAVSDLGDLSGVTDAYRGYAILRPLPSAPVGRTMIAPPSELAGGLRCEAAETVDLLGWPMTVVAMPFVSQDGEYLRCAHAAMWMVLQHSHLQGRTARVLPNDVHDAAMGGVIGSRQVPSDGLSIFQMMAALTTLGLSPGVMTLPPSPPTTPTFTSLYDVACRYVNSNLPLVVISESHAWNVVAYTRTPSPGHPGVTLYRHDDAMGPYIAVEDPYNEPLPAHQPWGTAILPLPPKIYMTAEKAEAVGRWWFATHLTGGAQGALNDAAQRGALTFQTYGLAARDYKERLKDRDGVDPALAREYRLSLWPRNIWVVEAVDRDLRDAGKPCVLGEVIIDPTARHEPTADDPGVLATHASGVFNGSGPDHATPRTCATAGSPYETGRISFTAG